MRVNRGACRKKKDTGSAAVAQPIWFDQKTEGQKIFGDVQITRDEIGEAREAPFPDPCFFLFFHSSS